MRAIDLTGKRIGRWTVVSRAQNDPKGGTVWLCRCDCGNEKTVSGIVLRDGRSSSCGCFKTEVTIARSTKHGHSSSELVTPTYHTWVGMTQRCSNPTHKDYENYGGRGISVCDKWKTFSGFLEDMGEKPAGTSIDRIDVDGNYCVENCRWANKFTQANNRSSNRILTLNGESKTMAEWSRKLEISQSSLSDRLKHNTEEDALSKNKNPNNVSITIDGETNLVMQWLKIKSMSTTTYYNRIKKGMTPVEALTKPLRTYTRSVS